MVDNNKVLLFNVSAAVTCSTIQGCITKMEHQKVQQKFITASLLLSWQLTPHLTAAFLQTFTATATFLLHNLCKYSNLLHYSMMQIT